MSSPHGGTLFVVGTPIGNLEDLTPRARRTLAEVSLILAEDTRRLRALAPQGGFRARLLSIPAPREHQRIDTLLDHLAGGGSAALVTDAGMPVISDPGAHLVRAAREAGYRVVPIPGVSAVATALAAAGPPAPTFLFLGFLPAHGTERRRRMDEIARSAHTVVIFEAPHRLRRTLTELAEACGPARRIVIARELTKLHEEILAGPLQTLVAELPELVRGEITLVVDPADPDSMPAAGVEPAPDAEAVLARLLGEGRSTAQAAREAARALKRDRRELYRLAIEIQARLGRRDEPAQ
ncbi:MAG: 16S rRNA (cytidine(1402)-2'-O)-methyltransferase [bacterium]